MASIRLDDQVAVITGAGGGLGREYALLLAQRGAAIVVNDLGGSVDGTGGDSSPADQVVAEITGAGGRAIANYDSVGTAKGGEAIIAAAMNQFGRIDILINNAGILRDKSLAKLTMAEIEPVLQVHLEGAFHVTLPAFRAMKDQGYGRILFTTSGAGLFGNFGQANYAAAKMGLVGLCHVVAIEGAKYQICANVLAPMARTRLSESVLGPMAEALAPAQVAPLVAYLVARECAATGQIFSAGGGRFARVGIALGPGWFAGKGAVPTPEEIEQHFAEISRLEPSIFLESAAHEYAELAQRFAS